MTGTTPGQQEGLMLFTERSLWTMVHGVGLGGAALLATFAALFGLHLMRGGSGSAAAHARSMTWLIVVAAALVWLTTLVGTYVVFPPYRAVPPEGIPILGSYPRSLILSNPETAWLHSFGMETKEHLPWIAAMLSTAVAFAAWRCRTTLLTDPSLRRIAAALLGISFAIIAYVSLLGVFINKVAPLE